MKAKRKDPDPVTYLKLLCYKVVLKCSLKRPPDTISVRTGYSHFQRERDDHGV